MRSRFGALVSAATVVGALLLVLLLEGCSASTSPQTSGTSTTETKPFGSLIIKNNLEVGGVPLDPRDGSVGTYRQTASAYLDTLLTLSPKLELAPGLAERWEISADGSTHTFYIRKGVKFHNGDDLTGKDVKFSIERFLSPEATHPDATTWRSQVASVELKDDYTVVLHLKQPQFELLRGFDMGGGATAVVPKKYIEENGVETWRRTLVGSGPWKVVNYKPAISMELEANEDYWDKNRIPKFKTLKLIVVQEEQTTLSMLKTGELDIAEDVGIDSTTMLKAAGLRILLNDVGMVYGIPVFYDLDKPQDYALSDVRVRKALSLATNRKEISEKLLAGYGEPAALWWVRTNAYFYDASVLKPDPYDPEGAKKLLAEAGYPNGFSTRINQSPGGGMNTLMPEAIGGYWGKIGVKAELILRDNITRLHMPKPLPEVFNSVMLYGGRAPLGFDGMLMYHSTKGIMKNLSIPRLDELIDKVPLARDPAEKKKMAFEAAVLARNEYSIIAVVYVPKVHAVGSKVGGITFVPGLDALPAIYDTITHAK